MKNKIRKARPRVRWIVKINGLPTKRAWMHIVRTGHSVDTHVPCALPPVDPTTYGGAHAHRDALRAAARTLRVNHYIMDKTSITGDWFIQDSPWQNCSHDSWT